MNAPQQERLSENVPYVVGSVFVVLFLCLCAWQIKRGVEKRESQQQFDAESGYSSWTDGMEVQPFQRVKAAGRYDNERQLLLENIVIDAQQGFYVITPLRVNDDEPLLLVNRGWIPRASRRPDIAPLQLPDEHLTIRGRIGRLPRAGFQMGDPVSMSDAWPRMAVFPDYDDVAAALGQAVQPFVLLLDAEDEFGFVRDWQPVKYGPGRHYGYAFQWFAMALMLGGLLIWNYRRRGFET